MKMTITKTNRNPLIPDWKYANHYRITLSGNGARHTTHYSQGLGIEDEPTYDTVLECLVREGDYANMGLTEFMSSTDQQDPRHAQRILNHVERTVKALEVMLGKPFQELQLQYGEE